MSNRKHFRLRNNLQGVAVGAIVGLVTAIAVLMIISAVMVNYDVPSASVKYFWLIISVISGFSSGAFAGRFVKSKGFLWGSVSASVLSVISIVTLLAVNSFNADLALLLLMLLSIPAGCIGGIISSNLR